MPSNWTPAKRAYRALKRKAVRFMSDLTKANPCLDCGRRYPAVVMEFDHRVPETKAHNVSALMLFGSTKWSRIQSEIDKCDLVCANCHRVRTHLEVQEAK